MFSIIFLRATIFSVFSLNYTFDALSYRKHVLFFFATKLEASSLISQKDSNLILSLQNALLQPFIAPKTCFALLTRTLGFLELYITKRKRFCFFVVKTRRNQLYRIKSIFWFVCPKIVLLPALLHLEKFFFQFAASHPGFLLHFTQNNVFTCVWLSDAVLESSF